MDISKEMGTLIQILSRRVSSSILRNIYPCYSFRTRQHHHENFDVAIVGGGIIGLATAQELITRNPNAKYILLEKESKLAQHQTGHNSGVIHAGIYYKPGSLKAKLCVEGLKLLYDYCDQYNIPYKRVGKLIVALSEEQVPGLENLYKNGLLNSVPGLLYINQHGIKEIEPHCQGIAAIYSPHTGIVDYSLVSHMYGKCFEIHGGTIMNDYKVSGLEYHDIAKPYSIQIKGENQPSIFCKYVITCGGLYSDNLSKLSGCEVEPKIVPFRGDYLVLKPEKSHLVKGNIYPVPNPKLPFLGVHFTPRMDGSIWLGPNAILAFKREGYNLTDIDLLELKDSLSSPGLHKLLFKHWKFAMNELYEGIFISKTVEKLQKYIPDITVDDVYRGPSGVRAQALSADGDLIHDFVFDHGTGELGERCLHVRNAPSPAATSSLAIAKMIADKFSVMKENIQN